MLMVEQEIEKRVLVIEPFYGGSHKQLVDTVFKKQSNSELYTLPSKKWHWRARTSALTFAQVIPSLSLSHHHDDHHHDDHHHDHDQQQVQVEIKPKVQQTSSTHTSACLNSQFGQKAVVEILPTSSPIFQYCHFTIFTSSVLNLAELVALRPDLQNCRKIVYFHENQLQYPVRKQQDRDFQYGYNQILSCLVADEIVFNSHYNQESFINAIPGFLKLIPDHRPDAEIVIEQIKPKCRVIYFAVCYPELLSDSFIQRPEGGPLHIVWPHRWEHDKDPGLFFDVMQSLHDEGFTFGLSVLGEQYQDNPEVFEKAKDSLKDHIKYWGYQKSKQTYYSILQESHVVVSTAKHEFFGVAMLEAVHCGCYPIAPNALVYPEHFPEECLYNTKAQLAKKLRYFCRYPHKTRQFQIDVQKYSWEKLKPQYEELLGFSFSDAATTHSHKQ